MKMRMGATHFLMRTLPKVATEIALHVLVYNLTRNLNIAGVKPIMAAVRASCALTFAILAGPGALTMLWAALVRIADENGKICSKTSRSFVALQSKPVKNPVSAFLRNQDPEQTTDTRQQQSCLGLWPPARVPHSGDVVPIRIAWPERMVACRHGPQLGPVG